MTNKIPTLSGDLSTVDWLHSKGYKPALATFWVGAWLQKDDSPSAPSFDMEPLRRHVRACQDRGITPLVHLFYFGDSICAELIRGDISARDYHGRVKSRGGYWELCKEVARVSRDLDAEMFVVPEIEWNKKGWAARHPDTGEKLEVSSVLDDPGAWDKLFSETARDGLKGISGGRVKVVTAPGSWPSKLGDVGKTLAAFPKMMEVSDVAGTQVLKSEPRHGEKYYQGPHELEQALFSIHQEFPGHEKMVVDFGFSSYGGDYDPKHPYDGGTGRANDPAQARAMKRMYDLAPDLYAMGVRHIITRSVRNSQMDPSNYHGYAERHWGVISRGGREKEALPWFLALAGADSPLSESGPDADSEPEPDTDLEERVRKLERGLAETTAAIHDAMEAMESRVEDLKDAVVRSGEDIDLALNDVEAVRIKLRKLGAMLSQM